MFRSILMALYVQTQAFDPACIGNADSTCATAGDLPEKRTSLVQKQKAETFLFNTEDEALMGEDEAFKDFIMLAAATDHEVSLTENALSELGWTAGPTVLENQGIAKDVVRYFSKGEQCVVTFSATDDPIDELEVLGGLATDAQQMCGFEVHAGIAKEMSEFMQHSDWGTLIAALNSASCKKVTAVGHSLGGALATVFAACANAQAQGFGPRTDFRLVTYAPVAASREPMYSGTPGTPFKGTRFGIVDREGNGLPGDTKGFRLSLLAFFKDFSYAMGQDTEGNLLASFENDFQNLPSTDIEKQWADIVAPTVVPLHLAVASVAMGQVRTIEPKPIVDLLYRCLATINMTSVVSFEHDFVASLAIPYGFKHALVDYQPLSNPLLNNGAAADAQELVPAAQASQLPIHDMSQSLITFLLVRGFPNHQACCYSKVSTCSSYFTKGEKACTGYPSNVPSEQGFPNFR